ncbi:MAG TPA: BrnA antitoxin family protein [Deltaproteobacteria bacterium]|nr:BrnA antitoxin family protein [Deltaproteobacteria bacterium]
MQTGNRQSVRSPGAKSANSSIIRYEVLRIDRDVLEYFRKTGKGYQTMINAVLRSYVKRKDQHHNHD